MYKLEQLDIKNKKVIIRCDFNVPIKNGQIGDDTRIVSALETINYCLDNGAKVILLSHLGKVKTEEDLKKNDLKPVAFRLSELLGKKVTFINETRGAYLESAISNMQSGEVVLMQNTRYEDLVGKKESKNDPELSAYWASLGDVFINDAFGTSHRKHASTYGIAEHLPSALGFLVEKEVNILQEVNNPEHPFVVVLGGAKIEDKISVIKNLAPKADKILIGGGMSFTFFKALGINIGKSLVDQDNIEFCKQMIEEYGDKIVLPIDVATGISIDGNPDNIGNYQTKSVTEIKENEMGLDIGPKTANLFKQHLSEARIAVWNGPLGRYEIPEYAKHTDELLKFVVDNNIKIILGGGNIVEAAVQAGYKDKVYHASTGGGATLEFIGGTSPLLEVLPQAKELENGLSITKK